jgi:hypothetical protein
MPCCPKCNDEFEDWVQICPDCGAALVDKLPEKLPSKPKPKTKARKEPLTHITTAQGEPLAKMWAQILENEGIHSLVRAKDVRAGLYMFAPSIIASFEILVLASQAEKAKEILAPFLEDTIHK